MSEEKKLSANEPLKINSNYLRGNLAEEFADVSTGAISADSQQLSKFHGMYLQDDRDVRAGRRKKKLEKAYSFLIRVRMPGGVVTPTQWLEMDRLSDEFANGTLKLTTRQAFQLHGVIKRNLVRTIKEINDAALDTIAACGDVNRNVMCNPNPHLSSAHAEALKLSHDISTHLLPQTGAYHEIFLDGEKVISSEEEEEPIYGKTYLPRKFKITVAVPPSNDVDIYAHCLSFIAIIEDEKILGYNVSVGGGMGMSHGQKDTFPRLADVIGFITPEKAVDVAEKVVLVQRDFGDRTNRKHARLKYTVERMGPDGFRDKLEEYLGYQLEPAREFAFDTNGDRFGWTEDANGNSHLNLFIAGGRVIDSPAYPMKTGLRKIAEILDKGDFRLTANQNLMIANVTPKKRAEVDALLTEYKLMDSHQRSALRLNSIACVALPTCGLALAESERYLPDLITELEESIEASGLRHDAITIRMTGCPNGCGRPFIAEIGFVGKAPGKYNVYLGGGFYGQRLNKLYRESVPGGEIKALLAPIIEDYAKQRHDGERFGDFVIRAGYIKATTAGNNFHKNIS
ncbi:MAG: NADPH-dependent assimilatory sulfite reductase hemoprotein subunit [Verrucomicrobiae bacterium]|nr:NADPH-dependent assimilatory sulfite reductase hemoprotein subunit [Verrucomicrobiae bacterium]NNJ41995.1 NADPH-dependent assimilatory sulfite reductase hemoprotein subunit [Akkermansiaceae bacterium]